MIKVTKQTGKDWKIIERKEWYILPRSTQLVLNVTNHYYYFLFHALSMTIGHDPSLNDPYPRKGLEVHGEAHPSTDWVEEKMHDFVKHEGR